MSRLILGFAFAIFTCCIGHSDLCGTETGRADGPLLTVQSASLHRFQGILRELQLPDPLASAGFNTENTLEVIQSAIDLDAPMGGFIYLTEERPFMIVCLPAHDLSAFLSTLAAFDGTTVEEESNKVYRVGKESPLYLKHHQGYLLIGDHRLMVERAATEWNPQLWREVAQDLKITAGLTTLADLQKQVLLREVMSLLAPLPSSGQVGMEALADQLQFGVRLTLCRMLMETRGFELSLTKGAQGELSIDVATNELRDRTPPPSLFGSLLQPPGTNGLNRELGILQLSSRLSPDVVKAVQNWIAGSAQDLRQAVEREELEDRSDMAIVEQSLQWIQTAVTQSVDQQVFDGCFYLGNQENWDGVAAVRVSNGTALANQLRILMASLRTKGLVFQEAQSSQQELVHYTMELPQELFPQETSSSQRQLHLRINATRMAMTLGNGGEALLQACEGNGAQPRATLAKCNLDAHPLLEKILGLERLMPFGYRSLSMEIKTLSDGQSIHAELSQRPSPTSETANAQVANP